LNQELSESSSLSVHHIWAILVPVRTDVSEMG